MVAIVQFVDLPQPEGDASAWCSMPTTEAASPIQGTMMSGSEFLPS
jgi:hypothetical protein